MVATRFPSWRVCENMSPAVSPNVVAMVLIIQNSAVTWGSFRMTYCAGERPEMFFWSAMNSATDAPRCRCVTLLKVARLDVVGRLAAHTAMRCMSTAKKGSALSRAAADATQSLQLSAA